MGVLINTVIALVVLIVGSFTDFKTREVPDWVSYGLIIIGFFYAGLLSLFYLEWSFLVNSVIGFVVFFVFAMVMFYTGQWGGGDSKIIMGLGALFGIELGFFITLFNNIMSFFSSNYGFMAMPGSFLIGFLVNILLVGAVYGLLFSIYLVAKNFKGFFKEIKKIIGKNKRFHVVFLLMVIAFLGISFIFRNFAFILLGFMIVFTFYLWLFIKAVENVCMKKRVLPMQLTEGDWIAKDVKVDGKYIVGPKDLGIEKKQIRQLIRYYKQKKVKKILIKEGIPFIPSFLLAFIVTTVYGNIIFLFI